MIQRHWNIFSYYSFWSRRHQSLDKRSRSTGWSWRYRRVSQIKHHCCHRISTGGLLSESADNEAGACTSDSTSVRFCLILQRQELTTDSTASADFSIVGWRWATASHKAIAGHRLSLSIPMAAVYRYCTIGNILNYDWHTEPCRSSWPHS